MKSQISQYPKVVSSIYDAQKPAQVISVSNGQRLAALGCTGEVRIVRVDSPTGITDMCNFTNSPINASITDLSWSSVDKGKLAISYSNGTITCLNVAEKASRQSQILTEEWTSGKVSTGVNRVSWHPFETKTIASANQDGIVRIFDFRAPLIAAKITPYGQRGFVATRDIEFDPFHAHILAEVSENGSLKVWDRRHQAKPIVHKTKAHGGQILSVSWSPCWEWVLATGSKDKTVKIWDVSECGECYQEEEVPSAEGNNNVFTSAVQAMTHPNGTAGTNNNTSTTPAPPKENIEPVVVNVLYTPSEVSRLHWSITASGNGGTQGSASIAPLLATISTGAGTSAESAGHIAVWDLLNQYLPLCILKGHGQDMCADFAWMNHSSGAGSGSGPNLFGPFSNPNSALVNPTSTRRAGRGGGGGGGSGGGSGGASKQQLDARRKSPPPDATVTAALPQALSEKSGADSPTKQLNPVTSLVLGILSAGRDGKVLMQDLRYGYFPNHHISPSVTAISSQGHVAFHRGYVHKKFSTSMRSPFYFDSFSSYCAALEVFRRREAPDVVQKPALMLRAAGSSDDLSSYAVNKAIMESKGKARPGPSETTAVRPDTTAVVQDRRSGVVFFGSQTILSLEDAKRIRQERAAEARVTDPALIALFARRYRAPYSVDSDSVTTDASSCALDDDVGGAQKQQMILQRAADRSYRLAMKACKVNMELAVTAGLHCRVAVWTTLLSLLPAPTCAAPGPEIEEVAFAGGKSPTHLLLGSGFEGKDITMTPLSRSDSGTDSPRTHTPQKQDSLRQKLATVATPVTARNSFPELPFTLELIGTLLSELLEGGDVQHFVLACEILRGGGILSQVCRAVNLSDVRVQRGYLVYLDLLTKLGLFCEATDLLKASEDKYMATLNQVGVQVGMKCSGCSKELSPKTATGWCERCARCVSICVVCNKPATGLIHWCPLCAHGGHLACTTRWFRQSEECPAGCGHNCCSSMVPDVSKADARPGYKRMESLRELEFCLSAAATRSRSNSRSAGRLVTDGSSSSEFPHTAMAGRTFSDRTVERHLLRRRKHIILNTKAKQ